MARDADAHSAFVTEAVPGRSMEARLATLEERTAPRPKTLLDRVKEWSGFATAVIAILYTFPLGFWDRWFEGPTARNVEALRSGIQQLADLEARTTQGAISITDVEARHFYMNAMGAQRAAILARLETRLNHYRDELTIPELILIAYNLGIAGRPGLADSVYESASQAAARNDAPLYMQADIFRMRALLAAQQFNDFSISTVRTNFSRNLTMLASHSDIGLQQQAGLGALQWAAMEATLPRGDGLCSSYLRQWAGNILMPLTQLDPQIAALLAAHDQRMANVMPRIDQEARGCPPDIPPSRRS